MNARGHSSGNRIRRRIEADLLDFFAALGWRLEDEGACRLVQPGGRGSLGLVRDGYQVWANLNVP